LKFTQTSVLCVLQTISFKTASAIKKAKANGAFKYLSTAGGAFLEWLEGNKSPGFIALRENNF
jgi:3-phosphoglycerate kinase